MRFVVIIFILLITSGFASAQGNADIDGTSIDEVLDVDDMSESDASQYLDKGLSLVYQHPMESLKYFKIANSYYLKHQKYKELCKSFSFLGVCYGQMGIFEKAFENFSLHLRLATKHKYMDEYVWANNNIGYSYLILETPSLSHPYLMEALHMAQEMDNESMLHNIYSNLGWMYLQSRQYDSSIYCYNHSLEIRKKSSDSIPIGATFRDIGNVHFFSGQYDEAMNYYRLSGQYIDSIYTDISSDINSHKAFIYLKRNNLDSAYYCINYAINLSRQFRNLYVLRYSYGVLAEIHMAARRFRDAEEALGFQIQYNDTIASSKAFNIIYENEFSKEINRQNTDISTLENDSRFNVIMVILVLVILISLIVLYVRTKRKSVIIDSINSQLAEHDLQLESSMVYARNIQKAVLPDFQAIDLECADKFMLFEPINKISGNFFWHFKSSLHSMFAVGSCGLPDVKGASVTMIATSLLYEAASKYAGPLDMIEFVRNKFMNIIRNFDHTTKYALASDISLLVKDAGSASLHCLGVKCPIVLIRGEKVICYNEHTDSDCNFFNDDFYVTTIDILPGDCIYIMTSGYAMQTGGPDGAEFSYKRLRNLLLEIHDLPMNQQRQMLMDSFLQWIGQRNQDHDLTIAGFRF